MPNTSFFGHSEPFFSTAQSQGTRSGRLANRPDHAKVSNAGPLRARILFANEDRFPLLSALEGNRKPGNSRPDNNDVVMILHELVPTVILLRICSDKTSRIKTKMAMTKSAVAASS